MVHMVSKGYIAKKLTVIFLLTILIVSLGNPVTGADTNCEAGYLLDNRENYQANVINDWTLTSDVRRSGDVIIGEGVRVDLNGYNLTVDGTLVLLPCSQLRAERGYISAAELDQKAGSIINLNNSQLKVDGDFRQNGQLRLNGGFQSATDAEIIVRGSFVQKSQGSLNLNGFKWEQQGELLQEGLINLRGGTLNASRNVTQKGQLLVSQGKLNVGQDLIINGGPLVDEQFLKNRSFNAGGGQVRVRGNVVQQSGQLYVNRGKIFISGNYVVEDGWLTMIHGGGVYPSSRALIDALPITHPQVDYVEVSGDFEMRSPRTHQHRSYTHLGQPMNDLAHLTAGVLKVGGNFLQLGNEEGHHRMTDYASDFQRSFSRYNFVATNDHRVILTGKQKTVEMTSSASNFQILEVKGQVSSIEKKGAVQWNNLIEENKSNNANLRQLYIDKIPVPNFQSNQLNYQMVINRPGQYHPMKQLVVHAEAEDHRNAEVHVSGQTVLPNGSAVVRVLVIAADGTRKEYTVNVRTSTGSELVTGIELNRPNVTFIKHSNNSFSHQYIALTATVLPVTAENKTVHWRSTNPAVATVSQNGIVRPVGLGTASIIATTDEGSFTTSANVQILSPDVLLRNIHTFADLVANQARFNHIFSLYNPSQLGLVVPGQYIKEVNFMTGIRNLNVQIAADTEEKVDNIEVIIDGVSYTALEPPQGSRTFTLIHMGLENDKHVEVIARNRAGDVLERVSTVSPTPYRPSTRIAPENTGLIKFSDLLSNPILFDILLDEFELHQLLFVYIGGEGGFVPPDDDPVFPVDPGVDGKIGTYNIEDVSSFSSRFSIQLDQANGATHYQLLRNGVSIGGDVQALNQPFMTMPGMLSNLSILEVVFYSDANGNNEVRRASLDAANNLIRK